MNLRRPSPIEFVAYEFRRLVFAQQQVAQAPQSFIDFPPMQGGASFNMAAIKEQIEKAIAHARSVSSETVARSMNSGGATSGDASRQHFGRFWSEADVD